MQNACAPSAFCLPTPSSEKGVASEGWGGILSFLLSLFLKIGLGNARSGGKYVSTLSYLPPPPIFRHRSRECWKWWRMREQPKVFGPLLEPVGSDPTRTRPGPAPAPGSGLKKNFLSGPGPDPGLETFWDRFRSNQKFLHTVIFLKNSYHVLFYLKANA